MANYAEGKIDCNGHSLAYDGIAYAETDWYHNGPRDTLVIEAGESEGIYMAEFNIENTRKYRKEEVWGNSYRRPDKYSLLISKEVHEPFIRNDAER